MFNGKQPLIGAVAIGRNEGERLKRCLRSLRGRVDRIVYVDSGSIDDSVSFARSSGVDVVELDMSRPFTMARGRNAGFHRLEEILPNATFVQFVDGDCEVVDGWIEAARDALLAQPDIGSVAGHRREMFRDATIYNRLTDLEWASKPGEALFLGGDVMTRVQAFRDAGGYAEQLIAGEDPEICVRLRAAGWKLLRLDQDMTRHDAAMTRFSQWWKRAVRSGHAYAEARQLHRQNPERPWRHETRRNWFWGVILPLAIMGLSWPTYGASVLLLGLYPLWMWRIACGRQREFNDSPADAWLYGFFCMLGKFPGAIGQMLYWWRRMTKRTPTLIEYKDAADPTRSGPSPKRVSPAPLQESKD